MEGVSHALFRRTPGSLDAFDSRASRAMKKLAHVRFLAIRSARVSVVPRVEVLRTTTTTTTTTELDRAQGAK